MSKKIAVITGGAGVLGSEMSKSLAKQGISVAILGRDEQKAVKLAEQIKAGGGVAIGLSADVCDDRSLMEAKKVINSQLGTIDILINAAGGNHPDGVTSDVYFSGANTDELKTFFNLDNEGIQFVFDLNFMGTLFPTKLFAADMVGRKECCIVNISSVSSFHPLTKIPAYSGAKAAINSFTEWLAVYFAKEGIRVNAIAPGFFLTEQNRTLLTNPDGSLTARGTAILSRTPMGRFGKPEDLISTLLWLCSPESRFVTGIVVPVDGGFGAFSGI